MCESGFTYGFANARRVRRQPRVEWPALARAKCARSRVNTLEDEEEERSLGLGSEGGIYVTRF